MRLVQKAGYRHVVLAPFMIGRRHANNDLAGDEEDSWKSVFEAAGFSVRCVLKGLGNMRTFGSCCFRMPKKQWNRCEI